MVSTSSLEMKNFFCSEKLPFFAEFFFNEERIIEYVVGMALNIPFFLVRAHKLNIDVATMFNPETLATLEAYKEQCDICLARMSQTLNEPLDEITQDQEQSA